MKTWNDSPQLIWVKLNKKKQWTEKHAMNEWTFCVTVTNKEWQGSQLLDHDFILILTNVVEGWDRDRTGFPRRFAGVSDWKHRGPLWNVQCSGIVGSALQRIAQVVTATGKTLVSPFVWAGFVPLWGSFDGIVGDSPLG